jgi:hypothetical protein
LCSCWEVSHCFTFSFLKNTKDKKKIQEQRLKALEGLVEMEILRSRQLFNQIDGLRQIKDKTQGQLDVIMLQARAIKASEQNQKKNP